VDEDICIGNIKNNYDPQQNHLTSSHSLRIAHRPNDCDLEQTCLLTPILVARSRSEDGQGDGWLGILLKLLACSSGITDSRFDTCSRDSSSLLDNSSTFIVQKLGKAAAAAAAASTTSVVFGQHRHAEGISVAHFLHSLPLLS